MQVQAILTQHEVSLRKVADNATKNEDYAHQMRFRADQLAKINELFGRLTEAALAVVDSAKPSPWLDKLQDALTDVGVTPIKKGSLISG